jgi:glutamate dehydrogenase
VRRGDTESDTLNRLVLVAGLDWRQVNILRAYRMYRQRIGSRFTQGYQNDVLAANPDVTAKLMRYFELRFDPSEPRDPETEVASREEILGDLDAVTSLDHDRILRNQLGMIDATLRTNAFKPGRKVIAFKLRSADVPAIPQPPPVFEIYVYSAAMEGIHLRGGTVARGGIRWSDRMDYRTEVYGLMRAQLTKNAMIVPAGAKGGFYLKDPPAAADELKAEVERQYVRYIGGLLELTDNLVEGRSCTRAGARARRRRHLPRGRRRQGHRDVLRHRQPGQRGARLLARRRVRVGRVERLRPQGARDHRARRVGVGQAPLLRARTSTSRPSPFTVVGIGDMSGDVFGNGMLLSDRIRLVGAYDHRHVFLDPTRTRTRLRRAQAAVRAAGSSWDDYDRAKISEGGGVWPRSAKSIPLSPQARAALASRRSGWRRPT